MEVSRLFQGSFKSISMVFQGCLNGVSKKFQECLKEASRVFQGSFKIFFKVFQRCMVSVFQGSSVFDSFIVACHSSQLPEQKEGLFLWDQPMNKIQAIYCLLM